VHVAAEPILSAIDREPVGELLFSEEKVELGEERREAVLDRSGVARGKDVELTPLLIHCRSDVRRRAGRMKRELERETPFGEKDHAA
jgi:hypothetical protein